MGSLNCCESVFEKKGGKVKYLHFFFKKNKNNLCYIFKLFDNLAYVFMKREERKYYRKHLRKNKIKGKEGNPLNVYFQIC